MANATVWTEKTFMDNETVIDAAFLNGFQRNVIAAEGVVNGKVDKVTGKALSTNDFTTALKNKLDALPTKAALDTSLAGKVDKVDGKGLSTNDYTNEEKQKVADSALQSDLDDLSQQISDSTTALDTKAPVILETASGAIASFADGANGMPIKSLVANIEPVQDLHGYDHPWPAGGGKNLLDISGMSTTEQNGVTFAKSSDGIVTVGGKANATVYRKAGSIQTANGVQYTITGTPSGGATNKYRMTVVGYGYDYGSGYTFTGDGASHDISIDIYTGYPESGTLTFKPMIRLATEADSTFAPYENLCQISGWTGADVGNRGKNLYNKDSVSKGYYLDANGAVVRSSGTGWTISDYIYIPHTILAYKGITTPGTAPRWCWYDKKKQFISSFSVTAGNGVLTPPANAAFLRCSVIEQASTSVYDTATLCIAAGNTVGEYEAYKGQTLHITFPTSDGPVYGGTLDVISGKMVVTDDEIASYNGETLPGKWISDRDVYAPGTSPSIEAQVVYKLATPIEYQLTPQEVTTMLGANHFWADVGPVEVTYPADTWTYLDNPTNGAMPFRSMLTESLFTNYCEAMDLVTASASNRRSVKIKGNVVEVSPLIDPANGSTFYSFVLNKPTRYVGSNIANFTPNLVADDFSKIHLTNAQRLIINLSILYSKAASTTTYTGSVATGVLWAATYDPVTETATVAQTIGPLGVIDGLERSLNITTDITHLLPAIRDNGNICIIFQSRLPCMKEKWVIDLHIETDTAHNPDTLLYGTDYRNNTSVAEKNITDGTYIMQNGALLQATENIAVDTELAGKVSEKTLLGILNDFEARLRALE